MQLPWPKQIILLVKRSNVVENDHKIKHENGHKIKMVENNILSQGR